MKKAFVCLLTALILFSFCACSVQTDFDIYDLCKRFNVLKDEKILSTEMFVSDGNGVLYCFYTVGETRLLISVTQEENGRITGMSVTVPKETYSENEKKQVADEIKNIFSAYFYGETERAEEIFSQAGIDDEFELFSDYFSEIEDDKDSFTVYSNPYAVTFTTEKMKNPLEEVH